MIRYAALFGSLWLATLPIVGHAQEVGGASDVIVASPISDRREDRDRAIGCLAVAIAYEAGHEPADGQQAVAEVILNRLRHAAFPKPVCGVVFAGSERRTGCQFSFACDGSLNRRMSATVMAGARTIAASALDGLNPLHVAGATHYHADYVSPYWVPSLVRVTKIGAHIFYRGAGARDQSLVPQPYAPFGEPRITQLDRVSSSGNSMPDYAAPEGNPTTSSNRPPAFAPWGLAPVSAPRPTG